MTKKRTCEFIMYSPENDLTRNMVTTVGVLIVAMGQGGCHAQQIEKNYSPSKRIKRWSNFVRLLIFLWGYHVLIFRQNQHFLAHAQPKKNVFTLKKNKEEEQFCEVVEIFVFVMMVTCGDFLSKFALIQPMHKKSKKYSPSKRIQMWINFVRLLKYFFFVMGGPMW